MVSMGPMSETTAPALVFGSRIRSNEPFTAADVSVDPSWNFTPSRRVNVNFFDESSMTHLVAGAGWNFWSESIVMSVSRMFCAISPEAAPVVSAGSMTSILSHRPQVSAPPLTFFISLLPNFFSARGRSLTFARLFLVLLVLLAVTITPSVGV